MLRQNKKVPLIFSALMPASVLIGRTYFFVYSLIINYKAQRKLSRLQGSPAKVHNPLARSQQQSEIRDLAPEPKGQMPAMFKWHCTLDPVYEQARMGAQFGKRSFMRE